MRCRRDKGVELNDIEELKKHLQFNLELLLKADASYELYQSFLILYQNDKEKKYSHLLVILIDVVITNCIIITTRLIDKREQINIYNTIKHAITLFPEGKTLLSVQSSIENENACIDRLCNRRDKFYAHSDLENLKDDIASDYYLIREDLHLIIEICFKAINTVNLAVNGYGIGGYEKDSKKRFIHNTKLTLVEIERLKEVLSMHDKMFEFMRENAPYDLRALIYSKLGDEKVAIEDENVIIEQ